MQLFVAKNGQQLGAFDEAQVRAMLTEGAVTPTDLGWHEGLPAWQPLSAVLNLPADSAVPPLLPLARVGAPALAGRGERLGAVILNSLLFFLTMIPAIVMALMTGAFGQHDEAPNPLMYLGVGISLLLMLVLFVVQVVGISTRGQSVGKKLCGVRIVRTNGAPAGFLHGFLLRNVVGSLLGAIPYVGPLFSIVDTLFIFRDDRRCVHDLIADTRVVVA